MKQELDDVIYRWPHFGEIETFFCFFLSKQEVWKCMIVRVYMTTVTAKKDYVHMYYMKQMYKYKSMYSK